MLCAQEPVWKALSLIVLGWSSGLKLLSLGCASPCARPLPVLKPAAEYTHPQLDSWGTTVDAAQLTAAVLREQQQRMHLAKPKLLMTAVHRVKLLVSY